MDRDFELNSAQYVAIAAAIGIPLALSYDYHLTLRVSMLFILYEIVLLIFKVIVDIDSTNSKVIEVGTCFVFISVGNFLVPHFLEIAFGNTLSWIGPLVFAFQSRQIVLGAIHLSRSLMSKIDESPELEKVIKGGIVIFSLVIYVICGSLIYYIYSTLELSIFLSSWMSGMTVTILTLTVLVTFAEQGVISEIALVSLYVVWVSWTMILEESFDTPTGTFGSYFEWLHFATQVEDELNFKQLFSLESISALFFALMALFSFLFQWGDEKDELDFTQPSETAEGVTESLGLSTLILGYVYSLLTVTGHLSPPGVFWRVVQAATAPLVYLWLLVRMTKGNHTKYD